MNLLTDINWEFNVNQLVYFLLAGKYRFINTIVWTVHKENPVNSDVNKTNLNIWCVITWNISGDKLKSAYVVQRSFFFPIEFSLISFILLAVVQHIQLIDNWIKLTHLLNVYLQLPSSSKHYQRELITNFIFPVKVILINKRSAKCRQIQQTEHWQPQWGIPSFSIRSKYLRNIIAHRHKRCRSIIVIKQWESPSNGYLLWLCCVNSAFKLKGNRIMSQSHWFVYHQILYWNIPHTKMYRFCILSFRATHEPLTSTSKHMKKQKVPSVSKKMFFNSPNPKHITE